MDYGYMIASRQMGKTEKIIDLSSQGMADAFIVVRNITVAKLVFERLKAKMSKDYTFVVILEDELKINLGYREVSVVNYKEGVLSGKVNMGDMVYVDDIDMEGITSINEEVLDDLVQRTSEFLGGKVTFFTSTLTR